MVKIEIVQNRLKYLKSYLAELKRLVNLGKDVVLADSDKKASLERNIHLAIESTIDIGNHIISSEELGNVDVMRDVPIRFFESGAISEELMDNWIKMVAFRNVLVHDYCELNREMVFDNVRNGICDLEAILKIFVGYL